METKELLSNIGLTERESKVYLALLELGSTTTGPLVKKSKVPNSKVYEILESLQNKGLVSYVIKGKIKYFQGANPRKILTLFKEKEREIERLLPELEKKQLSAKEKQSVEIYEGKRAIFALFHDLIENGKKGEEYYSFSLGKEHGDKQIETFYKNFGEQREKKGLTVRILANKETKDIFKKAYSDSLNVLKRIVRYTNFDFPQGVTIFKDNIVITDWENLTAILIHSKKIAEDYKRFFNNLWKLSKR
mgnify:FL=1